MNFSLEPMIPRPVSAAEAPETRRHQGIPGIERLPSGRLLAVFYGGDFPGEGPGNYVVLKSSRDSGLSWKTLQVVAPGPERPEERAFDSELWLDPDGVLWWFWTQCHTETKGDIMDGRNGVWAATCASPDAELPVWSEPRRIAEGVMMNKPIVLSGGSWLLPVALWAYKPERIPAEFADISGPGALISRDRGKTFEFRRGPVIPLKTATFDEHMIVERRDGTLLMLIRTRDGIWESTSADLGKNWSAARPTAFGRVQTRFTLSRLKSGRLLFIHHQCRQRIPGDNFWGEREFLTAWLSDDDGVSWHGHLCLDERINVSYPSMTEGDDGFLYVVYDRERYRRGQILLARFTESDVEHGDFLTPGSFRQATVDAFPESR